MFNVTTIYENYRSNLIFCVRNYVNTKTYFIHNIFLIMKTKCNFALLFGNIKMFDTYIYIAK